MSTIRKYRINHGDITDKSDNTDFYLKVDKEDGSHLCNFCISNEGIYYYKPKSKILSPKETESARGTSDSFISMEDLKDLLEVLRRTQLVTYKSGKTLKISPQRRNRNVTIEAVSEEPRG